MSSRVESVGMYMSLLNIRTPCTTFGLCDYIAVSAGIRPIAVWIRLNKCSLAVITLSFS